MPEMTAPADTLDRPLLVTGAGGQLGRAVVVAAARRGFRAVGLERVDLDVADADRVREVIGSLHPAAVMHCAAYTNVDGAEADHDTAFAINEGGSRNVAVACAEADAHLVAVSTDYVFPGTSPDGYAEDDETGPINVYGASKLAGEHAIRKVLGDAACIARTAWLFSAQPPNFVQTIARAAAENSTLDVVDDQRGNPTWCGHLADALVTCAVERIAGTHHLVDTPTATWRDLAAQVVEQVGASCEVRPTTSDAYPRPARRAAVSILRATRSDTPAMGDWRDGVRASLASPAPVR